jgi:DNA-binding NtrC family response regulator
MEILEHQPDVGLMFTDVGLPGTNGRALAETATAARPGLKVVYTSGYAGATIANLGLLEPNVRFLPKPFGIESLAKILRAALDDA